MVLGTLSFAGYISAVVMFFGLVMWPRANAKGWLDMSWQKVLLFIGLTLVAGVVAVWLYEVGRELDIVTSLLSAKSNSAASHVSDLWPDPAMLEYSSPVAFLFGIGGFSENLYCAYWSISDGSD